jgi:hypothetical protein
MKIAAVWVRKATPAKTQSAHPAIGRTVRTRIPLRRILIWAAVVSGLVVLPTLATYEQLRHSGGVSVASVLCFAFGGVVVASLANRTTPVAERLAAETVGIFWRRGTADLRGEWRSVYEYVSDDTVKTGLQIMSITQIGGLAYGRNIGGTSPHRHAIRMRITGDYVTGEWRNTVHGARHHGVFQLRIKANGREMIGKWIGFDSAAKIQEGPWTWERL